MKAKAARKPIGPSAKKVRVIKYRGSVPPEAPKTKFTPERFGR
jgi:hypothetical protein